jgi:hypothetical protein
LLGRVRVSEHAHGGEIAGVAQRLEFVLGQERGVVVAELRERDVEDEHFVDHDQRAQAPRAGQGAHPAEHFV